MSADLFSWSENLHILNNRGDLSVEQVQWAMREILDGRASNDEIKSFLLALKAKGESALEVNALVEEMYRHAAPISIIKRAVDTVIIGEMAPTINILRLQPRSSETKSQHTPRRQTGSAICWRFSALQLL